MSCGPEAPIGKGAQARLTVGRGAPSASNYDAKGHRGPCAHRPRARGARPFDPDSDPGTHREERSCTLLCIFRYHQVVRNSGRVFSRDLSRIGRARRTWIIVLGVLLTPALYAWFNISAFWDPYAATGDIAVAVVNLDEGASSELTGAVDVGAQVEDQLADNDELGWQFMDENAALEAVRAGDVYATIVIPADFSEKLLSVTTGDFVRPALRYDVNEKISAISPKITDAGATAIDRQITSSFSAQVAEAVTETLRDAGVDVEDRVRGAQEDSITALDEAADRVESARDSVADLRQGVTDSRDSLTASRGTLDDIDATLADVQSAAQQAQSIVATAQEQALVFTDAATAAYVEAAGLLADATGSANTRVSEVTQVLDRVGGRVDTAISAATTVTSSLADALAGLQALVNGGDLSADAQQQIDAVLADLEERNTANEQLLADLDTLNGDAGETVDAVGSTASALQDATQNASDAAAGLRTALGENVPALTRSMTALATSAGAFSEAIGLHRTQIVQAHGLLDDLDAQLASTADALDALEDDLSAIGSGVQTARTDILALSSASLWNDLSDVTGLEPTQIADFIASPVDITEHVVYPVANYGSAMAALFTNLSLWLGAFMLTVIFRTEVDTEGLPSLTVTQAYFGRFFLLAMFAVIQGVIVSVGNLIIGIQTVSAVAFVATSVLVALAYVSIVYALCVAFGHVGRGLAVLLVVMQIPGASGLYPIEMMPDFFRAIHPLLPFTYGIDAMRETIGGFYDGHYARALGILGIFVLAAFLVGLVVRRRMVNLARLFNREVSSTGLLVAQDVQVGTVTYRLSSVVRALSDRNEYRHDIARRTRLITAHYRTILRALLAAGALGLVIIAVVAWAVPAEKAAFLFAGVVWCLVVIASLVVLEYLHESLRASGEATSADEEAEATSATAAANRRRATFVTEGGAEDRGASAGGIALATQPLPLPDTEAPSPAEPDADIEHLESLFESGGVSGALSSPSDQETPPSSDVPDDETDSVGESDGTDLGDSDTDPDGEDAQIGQATDSLPADQDSADSDGAATHTREGEQPARHDTTEPKDGGETGA